MKELVGGGDQLSGRFDELRVVRVLPLHQMLDELKTAVTGRVLGFLAIRLTVGPKPLALQEVHHQAAEVLRALRVIRIGNKRSEHHRTPPAAAAPTRCAASRYARAGSTSPERI